jgi:L-asparaginase II
VRESMQEVTGFAHGEDNRGTDGCSIPTYAVPLRNLAKAFASMISGQGLPAGRATAARRLTEACMKHPFLVAGTGKVDTRLMQAAPGRIFVKMGAEGVYCGALPELGLGFALKCGDGAIRGTEVAVAALLAGLLGSDAALASTLHDIANPILKNWHGTHVGSLRPTTALTNPH